jgi:hypothetical protein
LYVDKDEEISGLGMELFVEDLEVSRDEFLKMDAKSFDGEARARIVIYEIPLG